MDVQRYISSGIIESYVAGLVSEQEAKELQEAMLQYPGVKQAVDACQQDMERYVQMFSLQPPKVVKEKIFELINSDDLVGQVTAEDATEKSTSPAMKAYTVASEFPEEEHTDGARSWRWVAAAAIILLLISAGFNYKLYTDKSELDSKYQALQVEQSTLMAKNQVFQTKLSDMDNMMLWMKDPATKKVMLPGASKDHSDYLATVYWNPSDQNVYIAANNLPEPNADQQYQLWAIVKGQKEPMDAGVFNMKDLEHPMQKMKQFGDGVIAFAITLEKKGGSEKPTMPIIVAGKTS